MAEGTSHFLRALDLKERAGNAADVVRLKELLRKLDAYDVETALQGGTEKSRTDALVSTDSGVISFSTENLSRLTPKEGHHSR